MLIAIDVDEVCCQNVFALLNRYNKEYDDSLKVSDITAWNIAQFAKPECGTNIFKHFADPTIYNDDEMLEMEGALWGVNRLREMGHSVIFLTAGTAGALDAKYNWLCRHKYVESFAEYVVSYDKSIICADVLLDDKTSNVRNFDMAQMMGYGYLFSRPWNASERWATRVENWEDFIDKMEEIE